MGFYKYVKDIWKDNKIAQTRIIQWKKEPVTLRIERPTRLDRARDLGYKPKQGIILVRQRISRGGRMLPQFKSGRRSKHMSRRKDLRMSYQWVAEQHAAKKFKNCEVLNSYLVGKDGMNAWYEIILIDRTHPVVLSDKNLAGVAARKGRVYRGLTTSGLRSRGMLTNKGKGAEKIRPSLRANNRTAR